MKPDDAMVERRMAVFEDVCRRTKLRATPQRLEVFRELARSSDHPSAEAVHKRVRERLPTITLDTVYRTLATLEKSGLVVRVSVVGSSARFEANTEHHHHFVCRECGFILDVYSERLDRVMSDSELPKGYHIDWAQVELRGTCPKCDGPVSG